MPVEHKPKNLVPTDAASASLHICGLCGSQFRNENDYLAHKCAARFGLSPTEPGFPT